jgi:site-specific DNA-methyltransferase (adenine-specific)
LAKLGENDLTRQNSVNKSGFGRNISKWVGQETVLPSNVLSIPLIGTNRGHPAAFPPDLPAFFIKLLSPKDGLVLDPFGGSGMTGLACVELGRDCILIDNKHDYCRIARRNIDAAIKKKEYSVCSFTSSDFAHWINQKENKAPMAILRQRHYKQPDYLALTS